MQCADFQRLLQTAVEERDAAAVAALAEHARVCPETECHRLWDDEQLIARAVTAWRGVTPSPRLAPRVVSELRRSAAPMPGVSPVEHQGAQPRRGGDSRSLLGLLSAAAALLVIVSFAFGPHNEDAQLARPERPRRTPAGDGISIRPRPAVVQTLPGSRSVEPVAGASGDAGDVGASYVGLATEATHLVTDLAMRIVPVRVEQPAGDDLDGPHWVDRLGAQIEPVREGVATKLGEWFGSPAT